jgi:hypothetical protein
VEKLGHIRVIGPIGAFPITILYSRGEPENWNEAADMEVDMGLHCFEKLCVFTVGREQAGARFSERGILFTDMSVREWEEIVRDTTLALYR